MKRIVLIALLTSLALVAYGADEDEKPTTDNQPAAEKTDKQAPKKEKKISETFTPSEEISEDLSVPFPVDI